MIRRSFRVADPGRSAAASLLRWIMSTETPYILGAIAIGLGASLFMDLWNLF